MLMSLKKEWIIKFKENLVLWRDYMLHECDLITIRTGQVIKLNTCLYSALPSMPAIDLRSLAAKVSSPDPSELAVRAALSLLRKGAQVQSD